jgi:glucose-6-phosphate isomerase
VQISLFNDSSQADGYYRALAGEKLLERLRVLDSRVRRKGLASLDPSRNRLIPLGMELDGGGRVTKNGYGVFSLGWQAAAHPEWAERIAGEIEEIREGIQRAHGARLRFLIWAGMGGSAEDKHMYCSLGLLERGVRCFVLDSTDPAKLKYILAEMQKRSARPLRDVLASTLVVAMAMGVTSLEPVLNLEQLTKLYEKNGVDPASNFLYMTLTGSLLEQFAARRGYRRVELQLDGGNTTAGRHSGPLTRGSLYPLALCGNDLTPWIAATDLGAEDIDVAWKLAAFLHAQGLAGRDKVTLALPTAWHAAALWTKQDFEESLGKSEELGIKIVIDEKLRLPNYRPPKDERQDRAFVAVHRKGEKLAEADKVAMVRRVGYPLASVTFDRGACLSRYLQFIHYTVFGLAWLRELNFVTQPGVELYKSLANRLYEKAKRAGGLDRTADWSQFRNSAAQRKWIGGVTLHWGNRAYDAEDNATAAALYASILSRLIADRRVEYGELTFFGDTRYAPQGRALRKVLGRAAELLFRARLRMPVDVYEGPAVNHSYHEMIIGHGRCFSTILLADKCETVPGLDYPPDYHRAQFLATIRALEQRGRDVVAITLRDLEPKTLVALERFFREAARLVVRDGR